MAAQQRKPILHTSPTSTSTNNNNKYASCPDWRISPHANHREIQIVYNIGRRWLSSSLFFTPHTVCSCPASLSHWANDRRMCYRFFNFWPWAKVQQRGDDLLPTKVYYPTKFQPDCTNGLRDMRYQSFSLFGQGANPWAKVHQKGDDLLAT